MSSNKHDPLYRAVMEFRRGILGKDHSDLMCAVVSRPLQGYLGFIGYETELIEGEIAVSKDYVVGHFWLRLPDGRIIDPTADQFTTPEGKPMPKIYIGELPAWYRPYEAVERG